MMIVHGRRRRRLMDIWDVNVAIIIYHIYLIDITP